MMLKPSLCHYSYMYIVVKETLTVPETSVTGAETNNTNKEVVFKNRSPITNCISEINNTQIDNAKDIDAIMLTYDLIILRKLFANIWRFMAILSGLYLNATFIFCKSPVLGVRWQSGPEASRQLL